MMSRNVVVVPTQMGIFGYIMPYYEEERRHHHHHHHGGRPIVEVDIVPPRIPRPVIEIGVGGRYPPPPPRVEVITPANVYQPPPRPIIEVDVVPPSRPFIEFNIGGRRPPPREEVIIVQQPPPPRW